MPATVMTRFRHLVPGHRARGIDRWTIVRLGIVAGAVLGAVLAVRAFGRPYVFFDLRIYHGAVVWWHGGGDLYTYIAPDITLGYTYPPFAALVMLPMAAFPAEAAGFINAIASLGALAVVLAAVLTPIADRMGWPRWFAVATAVPLAAATEPVRETLGYGQVNLLLFALIMADMVALRWRHRAAIAGRHDPGRHDLGRHGGGGHGGGPQSAGHRGAETDASGRISARDLIRRMWTDGAWAGVGIGLATAIKLTPALFILYLLVSKQWRAATTAIGTAIVVTFGGFLLASRESFQYFTSVMWQTDRIGVSDMTPNQSLAGLLARIYDSRETPGLMWLAFAMLMLAVGLSRAVNAHAEGDELVAFTLVGLTANVISPISWSHHLVFVLPAIIVLLDAGLRRRGAGRGLGPDLRRLLRRGPPIGLAHLGAALAVYLLFVISPIWPYEHQLPDVSHYADGLTGALGENSLAIALIALVAALPWRAGAEPAFTELAAARLRAAPPHVPVGR